MTPYCFALLYHRFAQCGLILDLATTYRFIFLYYYSKRVAWLKQEPGLIPCSVCCISLYSEFKSCHGLLGYINLICWFVKHHHLAPFSRVHSVVSIWVRFLIWEYLLPSSPTSLGSPLMGHEHYLPWKKNSKRKETAVLIRRNLMKLYFFWFWFYLLYYLFI